MLKSLHSVTACLSAELFEVQKNHSQVFSFYSKAIAKGCGVAVGKLVTTLWVRFLLCSASTGGDFIVTKIVFTFHCLVAFFEQLLSISTQQFLIILKKLGVGLYTLNTGLTNTNKLNKGIIL